MSHAEAFPEPDLADRDRRRLALIWGAIVAFLLALAPFGQTLARFVPACPLKTWTGIPCPGCGATRAALVLARFEPLHALTHYPLWAVGWLLFSLGGVVAGVWALSGRPLPSLRRPPWLVAVLVVLLLANWIFNVTTGV